MSRKYLLWFAHEHLGFRRPEIDSILSLFNIRLKFVEEPENDVLYWIVELDSEESAKKIASRSISIRWCLELWGRAKTTEDLHKVLNESITNKSTNWISSDEELTNPCIACPSAVMEPHFTEKNSFKITVETFCKHFQNEDKIKKIENFTYLPFKGSVSLKRPDVDIMLLEYYGLDPNNIPDKPHDVFVGRQIAEGQRRLISMLSLKHRKFIGNTSMDAQLSVLMANQAQIKDGDTVIDPFVGSGSLLVAAAQFGGYVWGTDIDFLMLHARSRPSRIKQKIREKDESIKANMEQYKKQNQYLDVVVSDFSMPLWRSSLKFDAIITDPPYGIRESTEKIGIERQNYSLSPEHLVNHIPSKVDYNLPEIFEDLLNFAARHLSIGKKLVFWYPCYRGDYDVNKLPRHPCLKITANSEQILSKLTARRLLTYEKVADMSNNNMYSPEKTNDTNGVSEDGISDFRTKYFNSQDQTRRERKEETRKKVEESMKYIKIKRESSKSSEST